MSNRDRSFRRKTLMSDDIAMKKGRGDPSEGGVLRSEYDAAVASKLDLGKTT
jgi:hypothetical protein